MKLIKYYDSENNVVHTEYSDDSRAELEAWLNDSNVEQSCEFDQFEILAVGDDAMLDIAQVGAVLDCLHAPAKEFWAEAAGGDMVPMTYRDVRRIATALTT